MDDRSFGVTAALYERVRPEYPPAALAAALPPGARRVVDIGAGTGKLARALVALGCDVVAVEPDERMRAMLERRLPAVDARAGRAQDLPVEDASVDAVLFGMSWHLAGSPGALDEVRRVLRPRGVLVLAWLWHREDVPWVAALLEGLSPGGAAARAEGRLPPRLPGFAPVNASVTRADQQLADADVVELVRTWSSVARRPLTERTDALDGVRRLLATHPELAGRDEVTIPQDCVMWRYELAP